LKRYHTHLLTLGLGESGEEWEFQRIGTASEKSSVEKELAELRERLAKVEEWKARKSEIENELERVWVEGGDELGPPPYAETVDVGSEEGEVEVEEEGSVESEMSPVRSGEEVDDGVEQEQEHEARGGQGEGLFNSSSSWNPAHRPS
jgi:ATP-binding cassette subfamily D (ALD) long-chain fatty acid import protein